MKTLKSKDPVCILTGNEFLPKEEISFAEQVLNYFISQRRLYLHETFLTEKIPEIAASSLFRGSDTASPQSQGSIAKILSLFLNNK